MRQLTTNRLAVLGAALVLGASVAVAQPPVGGTQPQRDPQRTAQGGQPGRGMRQQRGIAHALFRGITLSDAQKSQLRTIHQKYGTERRDLFQKTRSAVPQGQRPDSATRAQLQSQSRALMEREVAELRGILTPEQRTTFDANRTEIQSRMQARGGERDGRRGERGQRGPGRRGGLTAPGAR